MPVPALDGRGLLPKGLHDCTLHEVRAAFCWDAHRSALWGQLEDFLAFLAEEDMFYPICVDGSFTTDKAIPGDIDLVQDLRNAPENAQAKGVFWFAVKRDEFRKKYRVDYCPNLPNNNDFTAFFQYVGMKTAREKRLNEKELRGLLRVNEWLPG